MASCCWWCFTQENGSSYNQPSFFIFRTAPKETLQKHSLPNLNRWENRWRKKVSVGNDGCENKRDGNNHRVIEKGMDLAITLNIPYSKPVLPSSNSGTLRISEKSLTRKKKVIMSGSKKYWRKNDSNEIKMTVQIHPLIKENGKKKEMVWALTEQGNKNNNK